LSARLWSLLPLLLLAACDQKMAEAPQKEPLSAVAGPTVRVPVAGTVAREDPQQLTRPVNLLSLENMKRGQERYDIFCSPCHDYTGHGNGRVVQRGFPRAADLHRPDLRSAPDQHIFEVITNGYGVMFPYASRIPAEDRWAIVAYVRALQYSQDVPTSELSPSLSASLAEKAP